MSSKMVSDRFQSMRAVQGSIEQNAAPIARRLEERLRPRLERGERLPDLELLLRLFGRELEALANEMRSSDDAHERELADDAGPRAARDRHAQSLREVFTDLRTAASAAFGDEVLAVLRLTEPASTTVAVLAAQGKSALGALLDESIKLPKSRRRGVRFDREAFAEELSESVVGLQKAIADVSREAKEADASQAGKATAVESYDGAFGRIVPALAALYGVAEQDALAAKLRLNRRRSGMLEEPAAPTDGEPATPEPPAEDE